MTYLPDVRVVQTLDELHDGALATSAAADQRHCLPRQQLQVQSGQNLQSGATSQSLPTASMAEHTLCGVRKLRTTYTTRNSSQPNMCRILYYASIKVRKGIILLSYTSLCTS